MAGSDDVDHVEGAFVDQPVEMGVDEIQAGRRSPMSEQARLDVVGSQRPFEQRIVLEIYLANGKIVRGTPVGIHSLDLLFVQRATHLFLRSWIRSPSCGADKHTPKAGL